MLPFHWYVDDDGVDDCGDADIKHDCAIPHDPGGPCCSFEHLALVQAVGEFHHLHLRCSGTLGFAHAQGPPSSSD